MLLVNLNDTGSEVEAIRQTLECFGYKVLNYQISRPNDFINILNNYNDYNYKYSIISCHGASGADEGKILMPILNDRLYEVNEPKQNFGYKEIEKYNKLNNKVIINTGCSTGKSQDLIKAFTKNNNIYIAPNGDPEGDSSLFFIQNLFYNLKRYDLFESFEKANNYDNETKIYTLNK